ncbi:flagellin N-terminal helical domain-containing protein [Parvularcula lutaonensis]|uniref:Flagellin n=1 Tax=Parvularcula lutaonensis TaxID=491923 RepID=A0ABV7MFT9_9PROT|nr:flagellin [Parvularcula lutaonensis]GGY50729.1 hypothetical protein GCM10007148_19420 [Parvularcula lutaonensis]
MMKPISTFGQTTLRNSQLRQLEGDLAQANNELSTGKKTDVAKSIGSDLIRLQTIRNQFEANETYLRSINLYKQRYDIMEGAFSEVESAVQDLVGLATINGADALDSAFSINLLAEGVIGRVTGALNISIGGRYLFGGANVGQIPMQPIDQPNPNGFTPRQVITDALTGTGPGAPLNSGVDVTTPVTPADSLDLLNRFQTIFNGTNALAGPPLDDYSFENTFFNGEIGGVLADIRLPNNQFNALGNNDLTDGLREVLQGAWILSTVDLTNITDPVAYQTLMTGQAGPPAVPGALDLITGGLSKIMDARTSLGLQWQLVDANDEAVRTQNAMFNNQILQLENVDRAEVTTRLLDIENQLEASYAVTGRVLNLRLFNFVR